MAVCFDHGVSGECGTGMGRDGIGWVGLEGDAIDASMGILWGAVRSGEVSFAYYCFTPVGSGDRWDGIRQGVLILLLYYLPYMDADLHDSAMHMRCIVLKLQACQQNVGHRVDPASHMIGGYITG